MADQRKSSIAKNRAWFQDNQAYRDSVSDLDTYRRLRVALDAALAGCGDLLDIGNGGVFDYNILLAKRITAVDLFLDKIDRSRYPEHITFVQGSALNLPLESGRFDTVLIVMLLHHLVGASVKASIRNLQASIAEAKRVLRPGGRLVVAESCVPSWFYVIEKAAYPLAVRTLEHLIRHPVTLQYPMPMVRSSIQQEFSICEVTHVPKGRFILQFGVKVPSFITPAQQYVFTAT